MTYIVLSIQSLITYFCFCNAEGWAKRIKTVGTHSALEQDTPAQSHAAGGGEEYMCLCVCVGALSCLEYMEARHWCHDVFSSHFSALSLV